MPNPSDARAVLAANQAFYTAFARRDLLAMDAVWAQRAPVACIHPGWDALVGREQVMASWRAILSGAGAPAIECQSPTAHLLGDAAFVICYEAVRGARLIATNLFVREDGAWRMTHHHAAPVPPPADDEADADDDADDGSDGGGPPPRGVLN
jgi:ketosteroid isomerase-like protein